MSKALVISIDQWKGIQLKIKENHPRSVFLIRDQMREVLGFTTREHEEWLNNSPVIVSTPDPAGNFNNDLFLDILFQGSGKTLRRTIHLDFYDETKKTLFILTYM